MLTNNVSFFIVLNTISFGNWKLNNIEIIIKHYIFFFSAMRCYKVLNTPDLTFITIQTESKLKTQLNILNCYRLRRQNQGPSSLTQSTVFSMIMTLMELTWLGNSHLWKSRKNVVHLDQSGMAWRRPLVMVNSKMTRSRSIVMALPSWSVTWKLNSDQEWRP